jgi:hypothetical protein
MKIEIEFALKITAGEKIYEVRRNGHLNGLTEFDVVHCGIDIGKAYMRLQYERSIYVNAVTDDDLDRWKCDRDWFNSYTEGYEAVYEYSIKTCDLFIVKSIQNNLLG